MPDLDALRSEMLADAREGFEAAENRAKNADYYLREALRHLGIGDNSAAAEDIKRARVRLAGGEPAE